MLIVEDCEVTRESTSLCLQQHGFWPDMAEDGESAMLLLQKHDYDLLLFDVNLPGISGYALNSWYKGMCRDEGRAIGHVVAVTSDPDVQTCREFEIDQCLAKPVSSPCVASALSHFISSRTAAAGVPH